jgi:hypothetical protein
MRLALPVPRDRKSAEGRYRSSAIRARVRSSIRQRRNRHGRYQSAGRCDRQCNAAARQDGRFAIDRVVMPRAVQDRGRWPHAQPASLLQARSRRRLQGPRAGRGHRAAAAPSPVLPVPERRTECERCAPASRAIGSALSRRTTRWQPIVDDVPARAIRPAANLNHPVSVAVRRPALLPSSRQQPRTVALPARAESGLSDRVTTADHADVLAIPDRWQLAVSILPESSRCHLIGAPMMRSGSQVQMPGKTHSRKTARNISATKGMTPQTIS